MKKIILIVALVVLAMGALGVGVALAQDETPPPARGWMHEYIEQALAEKLGLTEEQVEEEFAAGKTMYQIALDNGIAEDEIASFLTEVHTAAFDKAVADGVITREQADFMLERMQSRWQNGYGNGTCPMHGGYGPNGQINPNGYGPGFGPGMMRNGWGNGMMQNRWQNP